jgi:chromosome partitioning protein
MPFAEVVITTSPGYDLIGANADLTAAEVELLDQDNKEQRMSRALEGMRSKYDYILIDCPPSLNMLTVNALVASDSVIIPLQCEYYALEGLTALLNTIEKIKNVLNPKLEIDGLLRTMYDPRIALSNQVSSQLTEHFGDKVYRTIIPRNVRLAEAPSHGLPALEYDSRSRGAVSYLALAGELIRRAEQKISSGPAQTAPA